ncbi:MerR family transcriptional regulator [Oxalobacteraceae bacterium R-40]|uniref:MerR family transcriptional regulator n=1 Tax=Keguizhuia sedimenti TaxID=3064264 RepID=A0ABU1BNB8_9BURK|nr:MerR family transcriptional regulator [Oxalobacteraceae bacterium R-40]
MSPLLTIAQTSLETGIAKEVLRKWEVRYGFPVPVRHSNGKRAYTHEQVVKLKLIKRLLDDGCRPAQIVPMPEHDLDLLALSRQAVPATPAKPGTAVEIVEWLKARDPAYLRTQLSRELTSRGLLAFVRDVMPSMNSHVGQAWQDGIIAVRDEHIYSEIIQGLVREALASFVNPQGTPRILLTTVPGEAHTLGIQMVEAVMSLGNAYCISMGPQSPLNEIASAATELQADIVALSFSIAFPKRKIPAMLRELRTQLSPGVKIWAGGDGTLGMEHKPRGVTLLSSLQEAIECLRNHRG